MNDFSLPNYQALLSTVIDSIDGMPLNQALEDRLNASFPPGSRIFKALNAASLAGIASGDLCPHEAGGIKYGRALKALQGYSVDLVYMKNVVGPHHRHPRGEIDMIMPINNQAQFDQRDAGWLVYGPNSAHCPTVDGGEALVLYLLPGGEIEFTRA